MLRVIDSTKSMSDFTQRSQAMTRELGVWTADDCALVLIDCQNGIRSRTPGTECRPRRDARSPAGEDGHGVRRPIFLSTVGVEAGFNRSAFPSVLSKLDGVEPIDRMPMNAFAVRPYGDG
jgi:hypothetical protein